MERLDKVLSNLGYGSRKEVKALVKEGAVVVNDEIVKDSSLQLDPEKSSIVVNGEEVFYRKYIYLMMNKPDGVVSATYDKYDGTVVDLLQPEHAVFNPFPVGRLDKDTVGLLILTNDGELNHRLISPKWHVEKHYYARVDKALDEKDIKAFEKGIVLDDGYKCLPAGLVILSSSETNSEAEVTLTEGKFHQVKRMFQARGMNVTYLRRFKFGELYLDEALEEGQYRELTKEELELLVDKERL